MIFPRQQEKPDKKCVKTAQILPPIRRLPLFLQFVEACRSKFLYFLLHRLYFSTKQCYNNYDFMIWCLSVRHKRRAERTRFSSPLRPLFFHVVFFDGRGSRSVMK